MTKQTEEDQNLPYAALMRNLREQNISSQAILEIIEIGTAKLKYGIPLNFSSRSVAWSPDGKYVSVGGTKEEALKVFQADKESQENIWTVID